MTFLSLQYAITFKTNQDQVYRSALSIIYIDLELLMKCFLPEKQTLA